MSKTLIFLFVFAFACVLCAEAALRTRREGEDPLAEFQKKISESVDSLKKAAEDLAAKVDFKQLEQDFSSKLEELTKKFNDYTNTEKKPDATAAPTP